MYSRWIAAEMFELHAPRHKLPIIVSRVTPYVPSIHVFLLQSDRLIDRRPHDVVVSELDDTDLPASRSMH